MRRRQLIEIEDQPWCPEPIRDGGTDYLRFAHVMVGTGRLAAPIVKRLLSHMNDTRVLDVCSGGGGPLLSLSKELGPETTVMMSDLYPNHGSFAFVKQASEGRVQAVSTSVNALDVPPDLAKVRTCFGAFHHFDPQAARALLEDSVRKGQAVAIFEVTERTPKMMVGVTFGSIGQLISAPFQKPFRWSRMLFTYLIPLIPLLIIFDGVVSCFRTYSPEEGLELAKGLGGDAWKWEVGVQSARGTKVSWLIGYPKEPQKA